jgi:hypothetical protein
MILYGEYRMTYNFKFELCELNFTMMPLKSKRRQRRFPLCLRLVLLASLALFGVAFMVTESLLDNKDLNCFCAFPLNQQNQQMPCKSMHMHNETIVMKQQAPHEMVMESSLSTMHTTLRSTLLYLLQSLPDNTTQREVSRATISSQEGKITIVTQGGVSKLPRLVDLVGRWLGPISCAILISTEDQLDAWLDFMAQNHPNIAEYVSFHVLLEQPQLPKEVNRHPINKLRNLALRNAETEYVFLNDADFMPPSGSHDMLAPLLANLPPKTFWVLPAFERFGTTKKGPGSVVENVDMIPKSKSELLAALAKKQVAPFHDYFPPGHAPCNYTKWYKATSLYDITYEHLFEPYVICRKQGLPEFFPTFRGFAFNKMSFFMEAHYRGFKFQVLPDAFVVHMNHGGRKGRNDKGGDSKYIAQDFRNYLQNNLEVSRKELAKWK